MRAHFKTFSLVCAILLAGCTYSQALLAQAAKGDAPPAPKEKTPLSQFIVACSPDKPIVQPSETIRLRAYAASLTEKPLQYAWSAPIGRVDRQGAEVRWDFTGVPVGV